VDVSSTDVGPDMKSFSAMKISWLSLFCMLCESIRWSVLGLLAACWRRRRTSRKAMMIRRKKKAAPPIAIPILAPRASPLECDEWLVTASADGVEVIVTVPVGVMLTVAQSGQ